MSLVAHYRLEGNVLDSVGKYHGTIIGSPTEVDGKLGKALDFDQTGVGQGFYSAIPELYNFSISFWINLDLFRDGWIISKQGTPYTDFNNGWVIREDTPTNTLFFRVGNGSSFVSITYDFDTQPAVFNEWNHFVCTLDNEVMRMYVNGDLFTSNTITGGVSYTSVEDMYFMSNNIQSTWCDGQLDDVRIYDHVLSVKEVKELSKAKVLHYTFDTFAEPTTNVVPDGDFSTKTFQAPYLAANSGVLTFVDMATPVGDVALRFENTSGTGESTTRPHRTSNGGNLTTTTAGDTWTGSCYVKGENGGENFSMFIFGDDGTTYVETPSQSLNLTTTWQYFEFTVTLSNPATVNLTTRLDNNLPGDILYVAGWQLEKKDHATLFVDGSRTGIVRDSSGQENHSVALSESTTPTWASNARLGSGAYEFIGPSNPTKITEGTASLGNSFTEFSISLWAKGTSNAPGDFAYLVHRGISSSIGDSVFCIGIDLSNRIFVGIDGAYTITTNTNFTSDTWFHIVMTWNGTNVYGYVNGVQKSAQSDNTINNTIAGTKISLGTSTNTYIGRSFNGIIDDVRIYATALTEDEIKAIYEERASVDSEGTIHSRNLLEVKNYLDKSVFTSDEFQGSWSGTADVVLISSVAGVSANPNGHTYALKLGARDAYEVGNDIPVSEGETWYWSFWANTQATTKSINFGFRAVSDDGGAFNMWPSVISVPSGQNWGYYTGSYTMPATLGGENLGAIRPFLQIASFDTFGEPLVQELYIGKSPKNRDLSFNYFNAEKRVFIAENGISKAGIISEVGPTDGLKAYFRLDGNTKDDISGTYGTPNNVAETRGIRNSAYSFNGASSSIVASNSPNPDTPTSHWSWSFWYRIEGTISGLVCPLMYRSFTNGWGILMNDTYINVYGDYPTSGSFVFREPVTHDNEWHHLAVSYNGDTYSLYVDSQFIDDSVSGKTITTGDGNLIIGANNATQYWWNGDIDEVRIYDRALSAEEVGILYDIYNPASQEKVKITSSGEVYTKGRILEN